MADMEKLITGAFAEILRGNREKFNTRFAIGKSAFPRIDGASFAVFLQDTIAPLVEIIQKQFPGAALKSSEYLFEFSLQMVGRGFFGETPKDPLLQSLWKKLMIAFPGFLAADPERFCGSMFNAVFQMTGIPGGKAEAFVDSLLGLAGRQYDLDLFLSSGRILAWKAGLIRMRETALDLIDTIPEDLLSNLLDLPASEPVQREILKRNLRLFPWMDPAHALKVNPSLEIAHVTRVGGFAGLGGCFSTPPEVFLSDGRIVASDLESGFFLEADGFGHSFTSCGTDLPAIEKKQSTAFTFNAGKVECGALKADFPVFSRASSFAITDSTIAITLNQSHFVFLIGLTGKDA